MEFVTKCSFSKILFHKMEKNCHQKNHLSYWGYMILSSEPSINWMVLKSLVMRQLEVDNAPMQKVPKVPNIRLSKWGPIVPMARLMDTCRQMYNIGRHLP
jgi:hypothetical protein